MRKSTRVLAAAVIGLATFAVLTGSAFAYDKLFIVANQTSIGLAKEFFTTLSNESIPLAIISDQFDKVKNEKYILVLGGAKGPGSVDDFVKQVLTKEEQEAGNQPEGKMFVKENVFAQGQTIIVFTGPDEAAAAEARKKSRKTWWQYFVNWFELDTSLPMAY
jgi:UDP-N-acetylglucosamine:LPS N-acetylglucosamine transferase